MVRFYWYGLTVTYLACSVLGVLVGAAWGVGGMILGFAGGATLAAGVALILDKSEGRENAFYGVLSCFSSWRSSGSSRISAVTCG